MITTASRAALRIGLHGVSASADPNAVGALRARLDAVQAIRLPGVLENDLLLALWKRLDLAVFREYANSLERRQQLADSSLNVFLAAMLGVGDVYRFVESVSGCPPIRAVTGCVSRMHPGRHWVRWHSDIGDGQEMGTEGGVFGLPGAGKRRRSGGRLTRVMVLTLNLGKAPVEGGRFQIRRVGSAVPLEDLPYERGGDGILFRLAPDLRHRSTKVAGRVPKTIFTCWFHA